MIATAATVCVRAEARGGGTVITSLSGTEPWRPRILGGVRGDCWARVALAQSRASLLRADEVALAVHVGPGAALELMELGATLAHDARGGAPARIRTEVTVADGGRLIWLGQPVIVAAGARVVSSAVLSLTGAARVLRGEAVVLGRAGEERCCGSLVSRSRFVLDGVALLDETLDTGPGAALRSPVVAGEASMIAAVTLSGARDSEPPAGAMQAHGLATAWRECGDSVVTTAAAASVAARWRALISPEPGERWVGSGAAEPAQPRVHAVGGQQRVDVLGLQA